MDFFEDVKAFNAMYGLPVKAVPAIDSRPALADRLVQFKKILLDEIDEVDEVVLVTGIAAIPDSMVLTMMADWLGDIIVYATSEAVKVGIPIERVLDIIMASNRSKLGADGKAIISNGKLQKGPNYWRPEDKIRDLLEGSK